jgi:hypothetical protein
MRILLLLSLFSTSIYAQTFGNGSDGACTLGTVTLTSVTVLDYDNCTTLDITGTVDFDASVTSAVYFRATGDVTISGTIDASAQAGFPGPGGSAGGTCGVAPCDGSSPTGSTGGEGTGGGRAVDNGSDDDNIGGGSGAGGSYGTLGVAGGAGGDDGADGGDGVFDGTNSQSAGVVGSTWGNEANFFTSFRGGVGGAAGGSGVALFGATDLGGAGGHGGGAIAIFSQGSIDITGGSILANADAGEQGEDNSGTAGGGGGGGGSGGSIFILAQGGVTVSTATITALGAAGGAARTIAPAGGAGGLGRIRITSASGAYGGTPTSISPTPYQSVFTVPESTFSSDIQAGCAARVIDTKKSREFIATLFGTFFGLMFIITLLRRALMGIRRHQFY